MFQPCNGVIGRGTNGLNMRVSVELQIISGTCMSRLRTEVLYILPAGITSISTSTALLSSI